MNWPSMWEDINDRAAESQPLQRRKLPYDVLTPSLRIVPGDKPKSRRPQPHDDEAAKWLVARQREREAAAALEARTKKYAADLREWNLYINRDDVLPLKRR